MNWIKRLFGQKELSAEKHLSAEEKMLEKLEISISNCNIEIKKAQDEIEQIKKWTVEAISEIFKVPNRFWYEEISQYDAIKNLEENKSIDSKVVKKCDEVIYGYIDQIKLREAKITLYQTLIEKYDTTKVKMEKIKKRSDEEMIAQMKLNALEKHSQRIDQLRSSPQNLNGHIEGTNQLDMLKSEAKQVIDEFEINEEVKNSLDEINQYINEGKFSLGAKSAIDEIEKLVEKIKNQD